MFAFVKPAIGILSILIALSVYLFVLLREYSRPEIPVLKWKNFGEMLKIGWKRRPKFPS